jgi:hypothetical protein
MENIIVLAVKARANFIPVSDDTLVIFNEQQLNDYVNLIIKEVKSCGN